MFRVRHGSPLRPPLPAQSPACRAHIWGASQRSRQGGTERRETLSAGFCRMLVNQLLRCWERGLLPKGRLQAVANGYFMAGSAGRKSGFYGSQNINNIPSQRPHSPSQAQSTNKHYIRNPSVPAPSCRRAPAKHSSPGLPPYSGNQPEDQVRLVRFGFSFPEE